ncbi:MAG: transposase [Thermodesulfobacteriota bacterium]|nr:transposase [Thermodesulfobacteriota bacterium]
MYIKRIPKFVVNFFSSLPVIFCYNHSYRIRGLLTAICGYPGRCTTVAIARYLPRSFSRFNIGRLLGKGREEIENVFRAFVHKLLWSLQPADEDLVIIIDSSLKGRSGSKIFGVAKRRANGYSRWLEHSHQIIALIAYVNGMRIPIDWRLHLKEKDLPKGATYKSSNDLAVEMFRKLQLPPCRRVIVMGDAGFSSNKVLKQIRSRGWHFIFAMARTRKLKSGKKLKNWVAHTPQKHFQKIFVNLPNGRKRAYHIVRTEDSIKGVGEVVLVHSRKRLTDAQKRVKVIATSLPDLSAKDAVVLYRLRCHVELFFKQMKQLCGLGHMQVRGEEAVKGSYAASFSAYAMLAYESQHDKDMEEPWSLWKAKLWFQYRVARDQVIYDFQRARRNKERRPLAA